MLIFLVLSGGLWLRASRCSNSTWHQARWVVHRQLLSTTRWWCCLGPFVTISDSFEYLHDLVRIAHDPFGLCLSVRFLCFDAAAIRIFDFGSDQSPSHALEVPQGLLGWSANRVYLLWILIHFHAPWPCMYRCLKHRFGVLWYDMVPLLLSWNVWRLASHARSAGYRWMLFQPILIWILGIWFVFLVLQQLIRPKHFRHTDHRLLIMLQIQRAQIIERLNTSSRIDALDHNFGFSSLTFGNLKLHRVPGSMEIHLLLAQ